MKTMEIKSNFHFSMIRPSFLMLHDPTAKWGRAPFFEMNSKMVLARSIVSSAVPESLGARLGRRGNPLEFWVWSDGRTCYQSPPVKRKGDYPGIRDIAPTHQLFASMSVSPPRSFLGTSMRRLLLWHRRKDRLRLKAILLTRPSRRHPQIGRVYVLLF